ncbi:MAG: PEGA domain-containing protein [Candidatus Korobacteraceae bacterium]
MTSHLYSFGIRGKQFQYVEGKLPDGFPFHGRLTDHDVRNLQGRGTEVIVIESHYTTEDLMQARADCRGETGTTPNQAEAKHGPPNSLVSAAKTEPAKPDPQLSTHAVEDTAAPQAALQATLEITSTPPGADIELDGSFVGNTPSSVSVSAGEHTVKLTKAGFSAWERKIKTTAGNVKVSPELQPVPAQATAK